MLIGMICGHLLKDLLEIIIGCLYRPIHLWFVWRRSMVLNLEFLVEYLEIFSYKICGIVYDDLVRNSISTNNVLAYESYCVLHCDCEQGRSLHPFCKVVNNHYDVLMSISCFLRHESNHINTPYEKWSRGS